MSRPLVSVCIITYQHGRFIAQAIEGALMQQTNFPVEILIGEDESTDGTREICTDYAKQHPDKVRLFLRSRREVVHVDGHPRGSHNLHMTIHEARGEFVALCEGDDYWTDPEKLQLQVDYLKANPDCSACCHDAMLIDADSRVLAKSYFDSEQEKFGQEQVLSTLLSRQPTCSLFFRKSAFPNPLPAWYLRRPSDLYLDLLLTSHGSLGYIRRNMAAYRRHSGGTWSGQREAEQLVELIVRFKILLADPVFFARHRDILMQKIQEFQSMLFTRKDASEEIRRLEETVERQTAYIAALRGECGRLESTLAKLNQDCTHYAKVMAEQTAHIRHLEHERER